MNLVAKEFAASRDDEHGVLILSTFAGAALELNRRTAGESLRRATSRGLHLARTGNAGRGTGAAHAPHAGQRERPQCVSVGREPALRSKPKFAIDLPDKPETHRAPWGRARSSAPLKRRICRLLGFLLAPTNSDEI